MMVRSSFQSFESLRKECYLLFMSSNITTTHVKTLLGKPEIVAWSIFLWEPFIVSYIILYDRTFSQLGIRLPNICKNDIIANSQDYTCHLKINDPIKWKDVKTNIFLDAVYEYFLYFSYLNNIHMTILFLLLSKFTNYALTKQKKITQRLASLHTILNNMLLYPS